MEPERRSPNMRGAPERGGTTWSMAKPLRFARVKLGSYGKAHEEAMEPAAQPEVAAIVAECVC